MRKTRVHHTLRGLNSIAVMSLALSMLPGAAGAQTASSDRREQATTAWQSRSARSIEEIVVSARKREESLADVPLAVSAVSGLELERADINSVNKLFGRIPGLYFTQLNASTPASDATFLTIRGVGFNAISEPATGVFIDGMFQPRLGFDIGFLDAERIEVLRGPQGTLFGRNTQAGALNIVTRKPDDEVRAVFETKAAQFNEWRMRGTLSGPVATDLYANISAEHMSTDGYVNSVPLQRGHNFSESQTIRGVLRWLPDENLEIAVQGDVTQWDGNEIGLGTPLTCRCYDNFADNQADDQKDSGGGLLTLTWGVTDDISLTSLSGYRSVSSEVTFDFDGSVSGQEAFTANGVPGSKVAPGPITLQGTRHLTSRRQDYLSQELRLAGENDGLNLDWLTGLYYFDQDEEDDREFDIGLGTVADAAVAFVLPTAIREDFQVDREGWALFGQANWRPLSTVELTVGARFSREEVSVGGERMRNIVSIENDNPTFFTLSAESRFSDFSPMASVSYDISDETLLYFTFAQGWKAGGINQPSVPRELVPFDSESSNNYEIGLKGDWLENRLDAKLALFWISITDQQLGTVTLDDQGVPVSGIANAGKSRSRGVELELEIYPKEELRFGFSGSYTDATFLDFTEVGADGSSFIRDGERFEFVPRWLGSVNGDYTIALSSDWSLEFHANYRYVDGYRVSDAHLLGALGDTLPVPSYDRVNVRASLMSEGGWRVTLFVNNLLDSFDYSNTIYNIFAERVPENQFVRPLEPRQLGVIIRKEFF